MSTDIWGIDKGYEDALGVWRQTPPTTRFAPLASMGVDPSEQSAPPAAPVQVVRPKQVVSLGGPAELTLEDGTALQIEAVLPPALPFGYHTLRPLNGGAAIQLIVSPGQCWYPRSARQWGWAVQLYALRSRRSWDIGDLDDLRCLADWAATALQANLCDV
jgi:4-alpha-glucanotransferase